MTAAHDQELIDAVAAKFRRGDLDGARLDCKRFFAAVADPARQAPLHFWLGAVEQRSGALPAAIEQFELALETDHFNLSWLLQAGLAHFQSNAPERAEALYREALHLDPRSALAHYNLGVLLQHAHDWPGAQVEYEAAVMQEPQFAEALVNLANTRVELADFDAAELDYRRALAINPRLANAHYGLGLQHLRRQQQALAARCFQSAVEDDPAHIDAWLDLAECLHVAGDEARAITSAEQALARSPAHAPAHATAQFKLAQYRGEQPDAAPHAMVERLYTSMADTFDEHLTSRLGYRIPALLIAELDTWLTRFPAAWSRRPTALDLGCGTGLFGQQVRPFVATVIGVDLSGPMLARARARDCYDRLIESDIESWLRGSDEIFDLITATDVLIYMGRLDELFARVTARLAPGGRFALSTETPAGFEQDYFLLSTGRYAHGAAYVERLAAENALVVAKRIDTPIRMENGAPLAGHVFILQKG